MVSKVIEITLLWIQLSGGQVEVLKLSSEKKYIVIAEDAWDETIRKKALKEEHFTKYCA